MSRYNNGVLTPRRADANPLVQSYTLSPSPDGTCSGIATLAKHFRAPFLTDCFLLPHKD